MQPSAGKLEYRIRRQVGGSNIEPGENVEVDLENSQGCTKEVGQLDFEVLRSTVLLVYACLCDTTRIVHITVFRTRPTL